MEETKICIVGAGPGGAYAALKLSYMGIPCMLLDRATFPRDKVCGDALSGKVSLLLRRLDPEILERFYAEPSNYNIWGIRFVAPNRKPLDIPFKQIYNKEASIAPGYVTRRMDFDNFLVDEVRRRPDIDFREGVQIAEYRKTHAGYQIISKDGQLQVRTKLLFIADGAQSSFSRKHAGLDLEPKHHAGAVRAYYRNVSGFEIDNFIELHFLKRLTPGYFWVFPLPNGYANVGIGMRTDIISKRKANLKKILLDILETEPGIRERFKGAELTGRIMGFGLPFGSKYRNISGDHYMLIGDAGHLIDPFTGEGIGNAMYSGFIAAEQAEQCLKEQNFSAGFLKAYDARVKRVLGKEMQLSHKLQKLAQYPWIFNSLANIIHGNQKTIRYFSVMYSDMEARKKLTKPLFWMRLLLKR